MKRIFAVLLIVSAVGVAYAPALQDGFVWDDTALVLRDPLIRSWRLLPEGFNHFLFTDATASDFYRPIQRIVYTLEYCAIAFKPAPYHLTNILWHAAAAVALFLFAEELLLLFGVESRPRRWLAFLATLIWAIHPVHSAAVIYVSGLADPLAAAFGFIACFSILRSLRADNTSPFAWLALGGLGFALSALSKESGLIFMPLSIAILALARKWSAAWKTAVVTLFVCAIYFSLRMSAQHDSPPPPRTVQAISVRPITMARTFAEYSGLVFFPINLHMDRQVDAPPVGPGKSNLNPAAWRELQTLIGVILIAAAIYFAVRARKKNQVIFTLLVLAGMSYLPVSGIWLLNAAVAEHWIYLPSAFIFLALAVGVVDFLHGREWSRPAVITMSILSATWFLFLGARTFVRTFDWKDQRTFLERNIASGGDSARMWINLGGLELSEGHFDLARKYLHVALQKETDQPLAVLNLAAVAIKENDFKTAREFVMRAIQMPAVEARANELLAVLDHKELGRTDVMRVHLATRLGRPDWTIEKRYIQLLDETGSTPNAIKELRHCLASEWYRAESWELLSHLLKKVGHSDEAAQAHAQAADYDVHLGAL